ncbi:MAG: hypothetical protein Q8Q05_03290 [bacterium]|nr:hypothetical protein [bacterium]
MRIQELESGHIPGVVSLLSLTMPWAPTTEQDLVERSKHCPDGQCAVVDQLGRVIGYGFILRLKAGGVVGEWYEDTGHGIGETHREHGNTAYAASTAWDQAFPMTVRALTKWFRNRAEQWRVKQVMGFSRIPSLIGYDEILRPGDVHDLVLEGQDPLTRLYWNLGFEPALPQPNYSKLDRESAGFGMMMVSSV